MEQHKTTRGLKLQLFSMLTRVFTRSSNVDAASGNQTPKNRPRVNCLKLSGISAFSRVANGLCKLSTFSTDVYPFGNQYPTDPEDEVHQYPWQKLHAKMNEASSSSDDPLNSTLQVDGESEWADDETCRFIPSDKYQGF